MSDNALSAKDLDGLAKEYGFTSGDEMTSMIAKVDLVTPTANAEFRDWARLDGTKDGLTKLIDKYAKRAE